MRKYIAGIFVVAILVSSGLATVAQTVGNGGFETPALGNSSFAYNPATGPGQPWAFEQTAGIAYNDADNFHLNGPADGQFGFLQKASAPGAFSQTINFATAGMYRLSYMEAGRIPNGSSAFGDLTYSVSIMDANQNTGLFVNDSTTSSQPFSLTTYSFPITVPGNYDLRFAAVTAPHSDDTTFIDDVSISQVPEPSGTTLLILGCASVLGARFRRR